MLKLKVLIVKVYKGVHSVKYYKVIRCIHVAQVVALVGFVV